MKEIINGHFSGLRLGGELKFEEMILFPLFSDDALGPEYLTMKEALAEKSLIVTEVDAGGSVPELKVVNRAAIPVLILDGEELAGAKQNRVLNTTVLLKEKSETIIPVSCTEQGRWSYTSRQFHDSGYVMSSSLKMSKLRSVSDSLESGHGFQARQGEVWQEVESLMGYADVRSPSMAMKDIYDSRRVELDDYLDAFPCLPGQRGLLVLIGGRVVGFDVISREEAYRKLHGRLVRSYALDAFLWARRSRRRDADGSPKDKARAFLKEAAASEAKRFNSVGHGWDYRFRGDRIVGSALVYRGTVIHTAFFRIGGRARREDDRTTAAHRRRGYRV